MILLFLLKIFIYWVHWCPWGRSQKVVVSRFINTYKAFWRSKFNCQNFLHILMSKNSPLQRSITKNVIKVNEIKFGHVVCIGMFSLFLFIQDPTVNYVLPLPSLPPNLFQRLYLPSYIRIHVTRTRRFAMPRMPRWRQACAPKANHTKPRHELFHPSHRHTKSFQRVSQGA
jgi:hypothetical protein